MKDKQTISKDIMQSPEEIYTLFPRLWKSPENSRLYFLQYDMYALLICHSQMKPHTEPQQTPEDKDP